MNFLWIFFIFCIFLLICSIRIVRQQKIGIDEKDMLDLLIETNRLDTIREAAKSGRLVIMDVSSHSGKPVLALSADEAAHRKPAAQQSFYGSANPNNHRQRRHNVSY